MACDRNVCKLERYDFGVSASLHFVDNLVRKDLSTLNNVELNGNLLKTMFLNMIGYKHSEVQIATLFWIS